MQALEFEADISGRVLRLPADIANKLAQGQHVRVIVLLDEKEQEQLSVKTTEKNPLAALLESGLVGCVEAAPKLSQNYKAELTQSLADKYDYRG